MKTIDFSYFIERYNAGEMDQTERVWFEKELEGNESLQKDVLLRKKADKILERNDIISLRNKLASIEESRRSEPVKSGRTKAPRFRNAAIFTCLIAIGSLVYFTNNSQRPDTIYNRYYSAYENPGSSRSGEISYNEAIDLYNNEEYGKALAGFQDYLKNNPGSYRYLFLSGISYMELKNFPEAIASLSKVIDADASLYTEEANWYLALCYVATNDDIKAKLQLKKISESGSLYKVRAKKMLRHL